METIPFHEQLRYERERRGWSQADLAEKVGCDTKTVSRWESGERFPRPYHRQTFCELFGKNAEDLGLLNRRAKNIKVSSSHTTALQLPPAIHSPGDPDASQPLIPGTTPPDHLTFKDAQASSHTPLGHQDWRLPDNGVWSYRPHMVRGLQPRWEDACFGEYRSDGAHMEYKYGGMS